MAQKTFMQRLSRAGGLAKKLPPLVFALPLVLAGCGGGSSDAPSPNPGPNITTPSGLAVGYTAKIYQFTWDATPGATHYELFEDPDGPTGPLSEAQVGGTIHATAYAHSLASQLLHERINASYRVRACNAGGCSAHSAALTPDLTRAIGYVKASNSGMDAEFGSSIALSADGRLMAVGARGERSGATGVNGNQSSDPDRPQTHSGAVYVFERAGDAWSQQAYIKASNTEANDSFGVSLALSADGSTLAVGAPGEGSNARGINGDQSNNSTSGAGAVYVFSRSGGSWSQQAYLKASNTQPAAIRETQGLGLVLNAHDFGSSVALSANGNILSVAAPGETSNSTGINGRQDDTSARLAGAVYVFARNNATWAQQAYVKASNTEAYDRFGSSIALSAGGTTLAVGAPGEDSNGNPADNSLPGTGAVYVFTYANGAWQQQAYLKANGAGQTYGFGASVSLSSNGETLAVGASGNTDRIFSTPGPGGAFIFVRGDTGWTQQVHIPGAIGDQHFAKALALSTDGNLLAFGNSADQSLSSGINGSQAGQTLYSVGAVHVYARQGTHWDRRAYLKASNADEGDEFGTSVALSADGRTLAVGAIGEDSLATGIGGHPADNGLHVRAGAVYLY